MFYLVVVVVPEVHILVLLTLFTALLFSARRFSDAPVAAPSLPPIMLPMTAPPTAPLIAKAMDANLAVDKVIPFSPRFPRFRPTVFRLLLSCKKPTLYRPVSRVRSRF